MEIIRDLHWLPDLADGSVVTLGEFDGVHRGHRVVLSELCQRAAVAGCPAVVVTFDRDPIVITDPSAAPPALTDLDHRLELLDHAGIDIAVVLPAEFVATIPDPKTGVVDDDAILGRLIDEVLLGGLRARTIIVGENFHFGQRRRTTIDLLDARSATAGFEVARVPVAARLTSDGAVISAMAIRRALDEGDVRTAQRMLGRPYELRSTVTIGDRRGRSIGFPTANLPTAATMQVPGDGVYAAWFWRSDGTKFPAAVNVGKRPTFYEFNERSLVEAHLIGFKGDLYGEDARLVFMSRLRAERKFAGIDELRAQLQLDIAETLSVLTGRAAG